MYLAMSGDRLFPAALAALRPGDAAPARATAMLAVVASLFVLSGSFPQVVAFFMCTTLVFVALAAAGLFVVRRRDRPTPAASAAPATPRRPRAFVLLVGAVVAMIAMARPAPALGGFALLLLGIPAYRIFLSRGALGAGAPEGGAR